MSFAKAVVSGTLVSDPEKRFTPNNHAVTSFTLAVENTGGRNAGEPFSVKVTCWRGMAEAVVGQLRKDDTVLVEGKLLMNSYQAQDGTQKKLFEIEAGSIDRLPGKPEPVLAAVGEGQPAYGGVNGASTASRDAAPAAQGASFPTDTSGHFSSEDLLTEDDIPF